MGNWLQLDIIICVAFYSPTNIGCGGCQAANVATNQITVTRSLKQDGSLWLPWPWTVTHTVYTYIRAGYFQVLSLNFTWGDGLWQCQISKHRADSRCPISSNCINLVLSINSSVLVCLGFPKAQDIHAWTLVFYAVSCSKSGPMRTAAWYSLVLNQWSWC
jgi:hypothetical protein